MTSYRAADYLGDLTDFQRRSVDHISGEFFDKGARRFLVADETGLGKTRVARGVIARTIEHLQDDSSVDRIDIVYVCSNAALAQQNLARLNVTGESVASSADRLTLLAKTVRGLKRDAEPGQKAVNLVSFTPGTSFEMGHGEGTAQERALMYLVLCELHEFDAWQNRALIRILQGRVSTAETFENSYIEGLRHELGEEGPDEAIVASFAKRLRVVDDSGSYEGDLLSLIEDVGRKRTLTGDLRERSWGMVRALRRELAAASVDALEPDLVILDEFQRFRHLLDETTASGELAHDLFNYPDARVLLLSATPYKPFTYAEEGDESHETALFETLEFLAKGRGDVDTGTIRSHLRRYRTAVESGRVDVALREGLRSEMLKVMSRAERPLLDAGTMLTEIVHDDVTVSAAELVDFARLRSTANAVATAHDRGVMSVDYWKSAPYFACFASGYRFDTRVKEALADFRQRSVVEPKIAALQRLDARAIRAFEQFPLASAKLRHLVRDTLDQGQWKLLWVPPSLPYITPAGVFAEAPVQGMTKRLVFSSWAATPTAVASLLSYEAERRIAEGTSYTEYTPEARRRVTRHFNYSLEGGRPASMSALAMFWPMSALSALGDPLPHLAAGGGRPLGASTLVTQVSASLPAEDGQGSSNVQTVWAACLQDTANWPDSLTDGEIARALAGFAEEAEDEETPRPDPRGLAAHVEAAREVRSPHTPAVPSALRDDVAQIAAFAPGNIALRVLRRWADEDTSSDGIFTAAATLANGLRSLFNRPDATKLIEKVGAEQLYWRSVLAYCADGNLEAVLDEYMAQLVANHPRSAMGATADAWLLDLARQAASVLGLRMAKYSGETYGIGGDEELSFAPRWALRYSGRQENEESKRQPEVREAFNSPFWPFLLVSTSVGQEGIDFHPWCHAVVHWNLPSNPVDFEQREGRVDRFRGHAVRKNVAAAHGEAALRDGTGGPVWSRIYTYATDQRGDFPEFSPGWVYVGEAKIERHVLPLKFTNDHEDYARLQRNVRAYRLTFGQPRQEDMLEVMRSKGVDEMKLAREMRIDLMP